MIQKNVWMLPAALLFGCVSVGKYDELQHKYDMAQDQLGERQQRIGELGGSAARSREEVKLLQNENNRARHQMSLLEDERLKLNDEQRRLTVRLTWLLEERSKLTKSSEELQQLLSDVTKRKQEADRRVAEFKGLLAQFKNLIDAGTLNVTITEGRMVLRLPTDVLFASGSAQLSKVGHEAIVQVTNILKAVPERHYQIEGHTDNVVIHTPQYRSNWELAAARGLGVVRAMIDAGLAPGLVSAASYGEYHPARDNDSEASRASNRRIEIIVVPDLSMLPGYQELESLVHAS